MQYIPVPDVDELDAELPAVLTFLGSVPWWGFVLVFGALLIFSVLVAAAAFQRTGRDKDPFLIAGGTLLTCTLILAALVPVGLVQIDQIAQGQWRDAWLAQLEGEYGYDLAAHEVLGSCSGDPCGLQPPKDKPTEPEEFGTITTKVRVGEGHYQEQTLRLEWDGEKFVIGILNAD